MTATLHILPSQKYVTDAIDRIRAVHRVESEVWDARDDKTDERRDLRAYEGLFLSATKIIRQKRAKERHDACKLWGEHSCAYEAVRNMSYRGEADELEAAVASYRRAREDFYNDELDTVSNLIAAE